VAFAEAALWHFFAAMLKALRACFAVLILEPLSFEIRQRLKPGASFLERVERRLFTMLLHPCEVYRTHHTNCCIGW